MQGKIIKGELSYRRRPADHPNYFRYEAGQFEIFVKRSVLHKIARAALRATPNETIGHLVGRAFRDANGEFTIISDVITAKGADQSPAFVKTTLKDELRVIRSIESKFPTAEVVGWFHSHPHGMQDYSHVDRQNQAVACHEAFHVGLLAAVDAGKVHIIAFQGPQAERCSNAYFTRVSDNVNNDNGDAGVVTPSLFRPSNRAARRRSNDPNERSTRMQPSSFSKQVLLAIWTAVLLWPAAVLFGIHEVASAVGSPGEKRQRQIEMRLVETDNRVASAVRKSTATGQAISKFTRSTQEAMHNLDQRLTTTQHQQAAARQSLQALNARIESFESDRDQARQTTNASQQRATSAQPPTTALTEGQLPFGNSPLNVHGENKPGPKRMPVQSVNVTSSEGGQDPMGPAKD